MTDCRSLRLASVGLCLLGLLLVGCGGTGSEGEYGDWTMAADSLRFTETLRVSETDAFYLGSVRDVAVTSDGRIVLADGQAHHLKVLAPDGSLVDTLGGPGEGPGEFERLGGVQVARGDSLFAYDRRQARLTVYGPDAPYRLSHTVSISREKTRIGRIHVLDEALVGVEVNIFRQPKEGIQHPSPLSWRLLSETGVPGDTLLRTRPPPFALLKRSGGFSVEGIPFARESHVAVGPDPRMYVGWPDSLRVTAIDPSGQSETLVSIPVPSLPVGEADRDSALSDVETELRNMIEPAIPDTKPAFTDLIVADDGRIWVQRPTKSPEAETVQWWILDPDPKIIHRVRLPRQVELEVVRDGRVYGTTTTDAGAPALVRYRIDANT